MGFDYDLAESFADVKGMPMKLMVASSINEMLDWLEDGQVDLVAFEVPETSDFTDKVIYCGPKSVTHQVLVQKKGSGDGLITDVTQLVGKTVHVERNSKYEQRIENLNSELGGGIRIRHIDRDSLIAGDLIAMVAQGKIEYTVVDSDVARLNATYFSNIDTSLAIGMEQRSAWAVASDNESLAKEIDKWTADKSRKKVFADIQKRYFELSKHPERQDTTSMTLGRGRISHYDHLFKSAAKRNGWDWRMLAAIAYNESHFNPQSVSWAGASGLMQVMPAAADKFGVSAAQLTNPDVSVNTAVKMLNSLDRSLKSHVPDADERVKFVLAAYNGGIAHIYDAMTIASLIGRHPEKWDNNVRESLLLKSKPEYYNHKGVKYGYFRGVETVDYVDNVLQTYALYKDYTEKSKTS